MISNANTLGSIFPRPLQPIHIYERHQTCISNIPLFSLSEGTVWRRGTFRWHSTVRPFQRLQRETVILWSKLWIPCALLSVEVVIEGRWWGQREVFWQSVLSLFLIPPILSPQLLLHVLVPSHWQIYPVQSDSFTFQRQPAKVIWRESTDNN